MSKVYKAVNVLNRGRGEREMLPGTLFQPTDQQLEDFLPLGAIEEASEAEAALFEKQAKARGKTAPVDASDAQAAQEAAQAEQDRNARIATLVEENDREALNALAAEAGVESPADLPNKKAVAEAIVDAPSTGDTADLVG